MPKQKTPELTFQKHIADYRPQIARHEQLGLNFAEVRAELFAGKEMGEDAISVLGETLKLHHAICGDLAAEREIVTAANRWARRFR
jgi:hypothetical protein